MNDADDDLPLHAIEIDAAELAKCTPGELRMPLFVDVFHFEEAGYIVRQGRAELAWAAVDLAKYDTFEDFIARCRKVHGGNAVREAIKAEKLGYYGKFFDYSSYIPDMRAIDVSAPIRGGNPMTPLYLLSIEERGGYPSRIAPEDIPHQAASWVRRFGVFRRREGHRQGEAVSDEQLLAYISLRRHGNFANYGAIIGHADHLAEGIMYQMHFEMVRTLLAAREDRTGADPSLNCLKGIRFIGYTNFYGIRPGMLMWKKRGLFEATHLQFDYLDPRWVEPLSRAAEHGQSNTAWQRQCAKVLAAAARRSLDEGRFEVAARAQAGLAAISARLALHGNAAV